MSLAAATQSVFAQDSARHLLMSSADIESYCRRSLNITDYVAVPSSEHVAEIVGRQGCKIKALRNKTNTYIKTPARGEQPIFVITGRKTDVAQARSDILLAADHFTQIRACRIHRPNNANGTLGCFDTDGYHGPGKPFNEHNANDENGALRTPTVRRQFNNDNRESARGGLNADSRSINGAYKQTRLSKPGNVALAHKKDQCTQPVDHRCVCGHSERRPLLSEYLPQGCFTPSLSSSRASSCPRTSPPKSNLYEAPPGSRPSSSPSTFTLSEHVDNEVMSARSSLDLERENETSAAIATTDNAAQSPMVPFDRVTAQLRVPYRIVGLVVGPKGATIKRIQQMTQTYIVTPSKDRDPVFEITGTPAQVLNACRQIEMHIASRTGVDILDHDNCVPAEVSAESVLRLPDELASLCVLNSQVMMTKDRTDHRPSPQCFSEIGLGGLVQCQDCEYLDGVEGACSDDIPSFVAVDRCSNLLGSTLPSSQYSFQQVPRVNMLATADFGNVVNGSDGASLASADLPGLSLVSWSSSASKCGGDDGTGFQNNRNAYLFGQDDITAATTDPVVIDGPADDCCNVQETVPASVWDSIIQSFKNGCNLLSMQLNEYSGGQYEHQCTNNYQASSFPAYQYPCDEAGVYLSGLTHLETVAPANPSFPVDCCSTAELHCGNPSGINKGLQAGSNFYPYCYFNSSNDPSPTTPGNFMPLTGHAIQAVIPNAVPADGLNGVASGRSVAGNVEQLATDNHRSSSGTGIQVAPASGFILGNHLYFQQAKGDRTNGKRHEQSSVMVGGCASFVPSVCGSSNRRGI